MRTSTTMTLQVKEWHPAKNQFGVTYKEWRKDLPLMMVEKPIVMCIAGHIGLPESFVGKEYECVLDTTGHIVGDVKAEPEGYGSW